MSNPFINLRKFVPLLSLTLVLVCFGFSLNAPGSTFAPTEEERVAATEQGLNGELKLAALPRKIDPEGRTYVEVDDMFFGSGKVPVSKALLPGTVGQTESFTTCSMQPFQAPTDRIGEMRLPPGVLLHH